jgi:putative transcriptional regulator
LSKDLFVIDLSFKNSREPQRGGVLISDPFLDEDYFRRSVILLCDHNDESSFGFVLNNYLDIDLHELDAGFPDIQARISVGGPVETQKLYYIHTFKEIEESLHVRDGLYFGGSFDEIKVRLYHNEVNKLNIRFFLGYSGWDKGQLKDELSSNSWIVVDNITNEELLNTGNNELWRHCLEKQGGNFKMISKFPLNPSNN